MELGIFLTNILYAIVGIILMYLAYKFFDKMTPGIDFTKRLEDGNIAVAIFIASIFISIALIISKSLN